MPPAPPRRTLLALPTSLRIAPPTCLSCHAAPLHRLHAPTLKVPSPTPFVPDVPTFLTLIGRNLSAHATKIPSWNALFSWSPPQLREAGIEPARARRYLLWWRERFRNGITGIGGDLREVRDGIAELRVVEVPSTRPADRPATLTKSAGMRKVIANVRPTVALPPDPANPPTEEELAASKAAAPLRMEPKEVFPIAGVKLLRGTTIGGTGVEPVKGHPGVARLRVREGLWEERRGHKVDGGERRKAEVRYKRFAQEKKMAR